MTSLWLSPEVTRALGWALLHFLARISAGGIAIGRNGSVSHGSYALCVSGWHSRIDGRGSHGYVPELTTKRFGSEIESSSRDGAGDCAARSHGGLGIDPPGDED